MCFSAAIDGRSASTVIVRGVCDVWSNMNSAAFVTDEQNARSLCPAEGAANLVAVRICCLSVRRMRSLIQKDFFFFPLSISVLCVSRHKSRPAFWPLFPHFSGVKISITAIVVIEILITAIVVIEIFIPAETSEDTENCQGCDFIKKVGEMK